MKKNNYKIGIFDSGIGGLSTLKEIKKLLPNESYIYYLDNKNLPFGEKSDEELKIISENMVRFFDEKKVKIIVIACNTMTTKCIEYLRETYPDKIFIGTEPAIKIACDKGYKNTLLMVTPATAKSEKLFKIINDNAKDNHKITILPCKGLADTIEIKDKNRIRYLVYNLLYEYKMYNYDSIVLGCTHYCHIKKIISEIFRDAKLIDGNKGVSKEVKRKLEEHNLLTDRKTKGITIIYKSKDIK